MRLLPSSILLLLLLGAAPAAAQDVDVSMSTNRSRVAVGETLVLRVRAEVTGGQLQDLRMPDLPGFQVVSRRVSRPLSFSFGFGTRGRVVRSTTEHVLTLRALEPGTHRIAPAQAIVGGESHATSPVTVEVTGSAGDAVDPNDPSVKGLNMPDEGDPPEVEGSEYDPQAFLRTVVDEGEPYVGQQITVSMYLYVRGGLRTGPSILEEPDMDGFWVHDLLPPSRNLNAAQQVVRGNRYRVYELRRFAAFPLRPGELTIGAMKVRIETGSLFDLFQRSRPMTREGVPVTIRARPLPESGPDDAVVGTFHAQGELEQETVTTGDAATLRVHVEGTGNLRDVDLELPEMEGLRVLAPRVEDDIRAPNDQVGGTRTFEWLLVPEKPGRYEIPALTFPTFDPASAAFGTAATEPRVLEAVGRPLTTTDEGTDAVAAGGRDDEERPRFGPIRAKQALEPAAPPVTTRPWYPFALAAPPLAWLAVLGAGRLRERTRRRRAAGADARSVRKRLREAQTHARAGEPRAFYAAIAQALTRALGARMDEPVGGYTHGELRRRLSERGMDDDLIARVVDELEGSDFARFSASGVTSDEMTRCLNRTEALLRRIDRWDPRSAEEGS